MHVTPVEWRLGYLWGYQWIPRTTIEQEMLGGAPQLVSGRENARLAPQTIKPDRHLQFMTTRVLEKLLAATLLRKLCQRFKSLVWWLGSGGGTVVVGGTMVDPLYFQWCKWENRDRAAIPHLPQCSHVNAKSVNTLLTYVNTQIVDTQTQPIIYTHTNNNTQTSKQTHANA